MMVEPTRGPGGVITSSDDSIEYVARQAYEGRVSVFDWVDTEKGGLERSWRFFIAIAPTYNGAQKDKLMLVGATGFSSGVVIIGSAVATGCLVPKDMIASRWTDDDGRHEKISNSIARLSIFLTRVSRRLKMIMDTAPITDGEAEVANPFEIRLEA